MKDEYKFYHIYLHRSNSNTSSTDSSRKKINNQRGESIFEVLVALLISSLALTMLAAMISSAASLVKKSEAVTTNYVLDGNRFATMDSGDADAEGKVTFSIVTKGSDDSETTIPMKLTDNDAVIPIDALYYTNDTTGKIFKRKIFAYKKD